MSRFIEKSYLGHKFTSEAMGLEFYLFIYFLSIEVFNKKFYFFHRYGTIHTFHFFLKQFWQFVFYFLFFLFYLFF